MKGRERRRKLRPFVFDMVKRRKVGLIDKETKTFFTFRAPRHILRVYNSFGISEEVVELLISQKVENIVLQSKEAKNMGSSDEELEGFIVELIDNHTIG